MVSVCVIIIIKVFFKCKTLSLETILSAYTHKGTRRHKHSDYTKLEGAVGVGGGGCMYMNVCSCSFKLLSNSPWDKA